MDPEEIYIKSANERLGELEDKMSFVMCMISHFDNILKTKCSDRECLCHDLKSQ